VTQSPPTGGIGTPGGANVEYKNIEEELARLKEDERNWDVHGIPEINMTLHEDEDTDNDTHIRPLTESDIN
jgi:hypothetical protein